MGEKSDRFGTTRMRRQAQAHRPERKSPSAKVTSGSDRHSTIRSRTAQRTPRPNAGR